MASPAPSSSPPDLRPNSSELNYFIASVAAVALLLLLYNAFAVGWCARHCPVRWGWRIPRVPGAEAEAPRSCQITGMIPAYKYRREPGDAAAAGEKGGSDESQCAVCLSAFAEGEDVRRLPKCGHSFHAACIDAWLCARASCPLCRASVLAAAPPQSAPVPAAAAMGEDLAPAHAQGLGSSSMNTALVMALV
ncbi:hypothetical protein Taro_040982 [Colocasia esculenta]|uniref:RING-type E3 ubiquitin transferase n=1 Tax=Colocasia esculenta TaxID=4460 RepID=A0A843WEL5_COLES|nr:hypothetical protein [Colocasia esculenta]